jgi:small-conductance mechanosensitive channel
MTEHWFKMVLIEIHSTVAWLPPSVTSLIMLCLVAFVATMFGRAITSILPTLPGLRRIPVIKHVVAQLQNYVRVLLMIVSASAVLPAMQGFSTDTKEFLAKSFACLFIMTLGFGVIRAFHLGTSKYLERMTRLKGNDDILVRSHQTQIRVLQRLVEFTFGVICIAAALMVFPAVRQYGVSLFASAGAASLVIGLSARTVFSNLIAGIQIAMTQPIRMEDMLILNGDWAWVEEISATYVVLRTWDRRRYIVPISYFLENPFQNWTHSAPSLIGTVMLYVDYQTDVAAVRKIFFEELEKCPDWDKDQSQVGCQVTDSNASTVTIRLVAAADDANRMWNMCCMLREQMLARLRQEMPESLPRGRTAIVAPEPGSSPWPDHLVSPPISRPESGAWTGPDLTRKSA